MADAIKAYKGFDKDMKCRGFQFEVGKTYEHEGAVEACSSGFHACENPFDVWNYYGPHESRFADVTLSGDIDKERNGGSNIAAGKITVEAEISLPEFVRRCVDWVVDATKGKSESGYGARIGSSGNDARIGSSGDYARIGSSGNDARIGSGGDYARIGSSGDYARIGSSGYGARIGSSGNDAHITAEGKNAVIACAASARIRAGENGAICIPYYDGDRTRFAVGYVGESGIEPGVWYRADAETGQLVECNE